MKTKKGKKQNLSGVEMAEAAGITIKHSKAFQIEQARKKYLAVMGQADKLMHSPAVREYLKLEEEAKKPSAEQQRRRELVRLYDEYSMNLKKIKDKLFILSELSFAAHDIDIPLETVYGTIVEINEHVQTVQEKAAQAFEMLGIEKPKEEEEKAA